MSARPALSPETPSIAVPPAAVVPAGTAWDVLPTRITRSIERSLRTEVVEAVRMPSNPFGGLVLRVRLADERCAVVEAASFIRAPLAAGHHRRELEIVRRLPTGLPVRHLLCGYDDGNWVVLVFEEVRGSPPVRRWSRREFDRALEAVTRMAELLTPSPVGAPIVGGPPHGGWLSLADDRAARERVATLSPLAGDHLDELASLGGKAPLVTRGRTLLHGGLGAGAVTVTNDRVVVAGWSNAWIGAAHCDVVTLLSSASLSGLDPQALAETHALTRQLDGVEIDVVLAMHAGSLLEAAARTRPAADPAELAFLLPLAEAALRWWLTRR